MSKKVIRAGYLKIVKFELSRNSEVTKITVNGNEANDLFLRSKIKPELRGEQGFAISAYYLKYHAGTGVSTPTFLETRHETCNRSRSSFMKI